MNFVAKKLLTPSQAKQLVHMGFILKLVKFMCREWDEYEVWVRS